MVSWDSGRSKERDWTLMENTGGDNNGQPIRLPAFPRQGWRAFRSEQELRQLFQEFFAFRKEAQKPPTMIGAACYLGMTKTTFGKYANGQYDDDLNKFSEVIEEAKGFIEDDKLTNGLIGEYNAIITKFDLSHNHGYAELKSVEVEQKGTFKHEDISKPSVPASTPEEAHRAWLEVVKEAVKEATE